MTSKDVQVDVTRDPMRMGVHDGRRILIPGFQVRVMIPFSGKADLWHYRTNPYMTTFPRREVRPDRSGNGGMLVLTAEQPADLPEEGLSWPPK